MTGSYAEVAASLGHLDFPPSLLLAFVADGSGVESFLAQVARCLSGVPVAGGVAARTDGDGELLPGAADAVVLAVRSGSFEVRWHNLLEPGATLAFQAAGRRALESLQAEPGGALLPAVDAFRALQRRHGKRAEDHESVTLSDDAGRNLHFHEEDGRLVAGADLPERGPLQLWVAEPSSIAARLGSLLEIPGTLLLGCAGLRSVLPGAVGAAAGSLGAFLFGEIGPAGEAPAFGNLMVTTVRRTG